MRELDFLPEHVTHLGGPDALIPMLTPEAINLMLDDGYRERANRESLTMRGLAKSGLLRLTPEYTIPHKPKLSTLGRVVAETMRARGISPSNAENICAE